MKLLVALLFFLSLLGNLLAQDFTKDPFEAEIAGLDPVGEAHDRRIVERAVNAVDERTNPWWQRSDEMQAVLMRWLGVISIVGTAFVAVIGTLWRKVKDLRSEVDKMAPMLAIVALLLSGCSTTRYYDDEGRMVEKQEFDADTATTLINTGFSAYDRYRQPPPVYPAPRLPSPNLPLSLYLRLSRR